MSHQFSDGDLQQIAMLGISVDQVERQIENFRKGFPKTELLASATIANGGITKMDDDAISHYTSAYKQLGKGKKLMKFVPASGAATRMFKDLYEFSAKYFGIDYNVYKEYPEVKEFIEHIRSFAFFDDLLHCMEKAGLDFGDCMDRGDFATVINILLKEQYMGYGSLPKGLIKFHKYGDTARTPLEEQIVEGIEYAQSDDAQVHLHFTVSPEHHKLFLKKIAEVKGFYESSFHVTLDITLSEQRHYTDIIAVDEYNNPLRDEKGKLVFRPGGHGALIENLNDIKADVIFIKNIDNVVPDWMKHTTIVYKQALAGLLLELQAKTFEYLDLLDHTIDDDKLSEIAHFATEGLNITLPEDFESKEHKAKVSLLKKTLNRPMRVCGMVRNQGEPGGGPFFTRNTEGERSLQIVEMAQINSKETTQAAILADATHFNPVDLVCATRNYKGHRFNLRTYVDPNTGFISKKSKGAITLKSQELPGLWNGSMAKWITIFVEVPLATFNPVKTVNDLLRKEHLES
jgi:hypothetical protein